MQPNISPAGSAFARALRTYQSGGSTLGDLLSQVSHQLAAGAPPGELMDILRRREKVEPLANEVRQAVMALLVPGEPTKSSLSAGPVVPPEAPTINLGEVEGGDRSPAATDTQPSWAEGDVLGERFQLVQLIGEGGMSRVYKAIDALRAEEPAPSPFIAIKVLTRPFNEHSGTFAAFQQEIDKLRALSHANIVRTYDCGRDGTTVYVTMEYLVGTSLYARLHVGTPGTAKGIAPPDALAIIDAIAEALAYAHGHQIVHGDLKPGNVIVTEAGEVKVIDFGIASWVARPKSALERREAAQVHPGSAVTPRYASPQLMARQKPETTDDVYALACLAYELLTGSHPFDEGNGAQALRAPPPLRAGLTSGQYDAVLKGLQFERRNRTPSVRQFIDELRAPPARRSGAARAIAFGVAALLALGIWLYGRPPKIDLPPPTPNESTPEVVPASTLPAVPKPGSVIRDCPTCPQLTVLPIGQFDQGSAIDEAGALPFEMPRHSVTIGYALAVSTSDITVGDFREFASATGREMHGCDTYNGEWQRRPKASWIDPGFKQDDTHPATCVSWNDAAAYVQWLSTKSGHSYRLPSASEWEYAARAGGAAVQPWQANAGSACDYANVADQSAARRYPGWDTFACDDGYVNTAPVGSFKANAFGLNDMLGNVFQWTQDCWHDDYAGAPADGTARTDGDCAQHELRGGSWFSTPSYTRTAYRNRFAADYRTSSVGFRVVREVGR